MSIVTNNIKSANIALLENISISQSNQIKKIKDIFSEKNKRSYDQTTKQDISISFVEGKYRFQIKKNEETNKENEVYMYQVWKKNNDELNSSRNYKYFSLRQWIMAFNNTKTENFTPTTMIELNNDFYPTVMVDAKIEEDNCVFYFDSSSITGSYVQLPQSGTYYNVRFDIDDIISIYSFNSNRLNINITFGNLTILNGTLDLISIPNQNLWQVTSFTSSNGTIYNLPSISYYPFENNSIINRSNNSRGVYLIRIKLITLIIINRIIIRMGRRKNGSLQII